MTCLKFSTFFSPEKTLNASNRNACDENINQKSFEGGKAEHDYAMNF